MSVGNHSEAANLQGPMVMDHSVLECGIQYINDADEMPKIVTPYDMTQGCKDLKRLCRD